MRPSGLGSFIFLVTFGLCAHFPALGSQADASSQSSKIISRLTEANQETSLPKRLLKLEMVRKSLTQGTERKSSVAPEIEDLVLWLSLQTRLEYALEILHQADRTQDTEEQIQKVMRDWDYLNKNFPDSPYLKYRERELARAELISAALLSKGTKKQKVLALQQFSRGFTRLYYNGAQNSQGVLAPALEGPAWQWLDPLYLKRYVELCKSDLESCREWVLRLNRLLPKWAEVRAPLAELPEIEAPQPPATETGRTSQAYRSVEPDAKLLEEFQIAISSGELKKAEELYEAFFKTYPKSSLRHRLLYWAATSREEVLPKPSSSTSTLSLIAHESPLSFYGLLATLRLKNDPLMAMNQLSGSFRTEGPMINPSPRENFDSRSSPQEVRTSRRLSYFEAEKDLRPIKLELRDLKYRSTQPADQILRVAGYNHQLKQHGAVFSALSELIARTPNVSGGLILELMVTTTLDWIFPMDFLEKIEPAALRAGVDPVLVLSLIKQESAFNAQVLSSAGAVGLMQLMPYTAREVDPEASVASLRDPSKNIELGVAYLKHLLTKFKGNIALSLAGYNAGPSAADRWHRALLALPHRKKSCLDFIETIPYRETKDYVATIIRNYYWYSFRLGRPLPESLDGFFWKSQ